LFINSVRHAASELKKAGLNVTIDERETEGSWEISIVVPKKSSGKPRSRGRRQQVTSSSFADEKGLPSTRVVER